MENIFEQLFSLSTVVFCLVIAILVKIQRELVEKLYVNIVDSKWWNEFLVPLGPLGTGGLLAALIVDYPYPADFQTFWARVFFGVVCGLASAHAFKMANKLWPGSPVFRFLGKSSKHRRVK